MHDSPSTRRHGKALVSWSVTKGLRRTGGARGGGPEGAREPMEALAAIEKLTDPSLVVLKDFHPYLNDPAVIRGLRELAHALKTTYTTVILLSPTLVIPPELEKEISVLDVPLPTSRELLDLLREIVTVVRKNNRAQVNLKREDADAIGVSILSGAHMTIFPAVLELLEAQQAGDIKVFGGGIIPQDDVPKLKSKGVAELFLPGTSTQTTVEWIRANVKPRPAAAL